jgi:hypothetical protein
MSQNTGHETPCGFVFKADRETPLEYENRQTRGVIQGVIFRTIGTTLITGPSDLNVEQVEVAFFYDTNGFRCLDREAFDEIFQRQLSD